MTYQEDVIMYGSILKDVRLIAKEHGWKPGKLTTITTKSDDYQNEYEVYENDILVWYGGAYCASDAKYRWMSERLNRAGVTV